MVKCHIRQGTEIALRDFESFVARIDTVQMPDTRGEKSRPAAAPAADIHANGISIYEIPSKTRKIGVELGLEFFL